MTLAKLLAVVEPLTSFGPVDVDISGLAYDSRAVAAGHVFFALSGVKVNGLDFVPQAIAQGAVAVVGEADGVSLPQGCCYVRVANARTALSLMAAEFYGQPSRDVPVIGVTGTNGKTTITYVLEQILLAAGYQPAVFGTVDYRCGAYCCASSHTTPESLELIRMMADFRERGADAFILEVSSHALEQHRVDGVDFDVAVFTNLTAEHLDYHVTLDAYFASKRRLFTELLRSGCGVVNADDDYGRRLLQENPQLLSFGCKDNACQVAPRQIVVGRSGIHGAFATPTGDVPIDSSLIGDFNVSNLLAAVAAAQGLGIEKEHIAQGVRCMLQVPGRVEAVANDRGVLALVDYAHTGDALEQVLKTLVKLEHNRALTLVGCGGDRDPSKRPVMARVAVAYSDLAVFTSDNPRTEDPLKILAQIRQGALAAGARELTLEQAQNGEEGFVVIPDRRTAIAFASAAASSGDLLLVAGKGHEDYQILGTTKIHFDDREELGRALLQTQPQQELRHV